MTFDKFELSVTVVDESSVDSVLSYELTAATYAAAVTDSAAIVAALEAVTQSAVKGQRISGVYYDSAFAAPTSGRSNSEKAVVTGLISGVPTKSAVFAIPNPEDTLFGAPATRAFNVVDLTDAALIAYGALFQTGGKALISDGEVLGALVKGVRVTRSSRQP
jgi:hypothetical protein